MIDCKFSAASGPIIGIALGILVAAKSSAGSDDQGMFLITGILLGGLAGSIMLILDRPKQQPAVQKNWVGKSLAVIGVLLSPVPQLGFVFNVIVVFVNWRADDWSRPTSFLAWGVSLIALRWFDLHSSSEY